MRRIFGARQESPDANLVKRELILDERVLVISTFELNKVASLTYNELVCDDIFEMIEVILAQPLRHTALALSKTLTVMLHCLVYGSEKCVNSGYGISRFVEGLREYNTVLIAQQRQGLGGAISRIKGGGVDKGEPVRETAKKICVLLANIKDLQRIRHENASKDSLVPVGNNKVGFITDEVRLLILQKRIEKQNQINLKSNLAKAEGGFGGGYNAADGKSVVGAAHGIEEMMKMAKQQKKKFSDEGIAQVGEPEDERILRELMEEANAVKKAQEKALQEAASERQAQEAANAQELDLLSFGGGGVVTAPSPAPAATADLLGGGGMDLMGGGGGGGMTAPAPTGDLLGGMVTMDPFSANTGTPAAQPQTSLLNGLLSFAIGQNISSVPSSATKPTHVSAPAPAPMHDPFGDMVLGPASGNSAPVYTGDAFNAAPSISVSQDHDAGVCTLGMQNMILAEQPPAMQQQQTPALMAASEDRFAALDALAGNTSSNQYMESPHMGFALPPSTTPNQPSFVATPEYPSQPTAISAGAGRIATRYGDAGNDNDDDEDNPWVMGGTAGTGLSDPVSPPPGAAPPPPPP
ncbi:unnamed protein product [Cylindrotheca closterium]|uniref:ENTH domain-containing protein n=1 Tax=Cylindrotheca closterium TaxID=2856 RepID=A0AAD2JPA7_9STRA|nr:unnamed protein product [Cylindrotheca closterium]